MGKSLDLENYIYINIYCYFSIPHVVPNSHGNGQLSIPEGKSSPGDTGRTRNGQESSKAREAILLKEIQVTWDKQYTLESRKLNVNGCLEVHTCFLQNLPKIACFFQARPIAWNPALLTWPGRPAEGFQVTCFVGKWNFKQILPVKRQSFPKIKELPVPPFKRIFWWQSNA